MNINSWFMTVAKLYIPAVTAVRYCICSLRSSTVIASGQEYINYYFKVPLFYTLYTDTTIPKRSFTVSCLQHLHNFGSSIDEATSISPCPFAAISRNIYDCTGQPSCW